MRPALEAALASALGADVRSSRSVAGGDINRALCLELTDGRRVFVKHHERAPTGMFEAEARGLAWLAEAGALPGPRVLAVGSGAAPFLALEWIESARRAENFDELLGRGLAALHTAHPAGFGLDHDNFIGSLPQTNTPLIDWPSFYRERRIRPLYEEARTRGLVPAAAVEDLEHILAELPSLVGVAEPAARLHGDLWGGNAMADASGAPVLFDPAVYGGHREVDLAMMRLFGGFRQRVFEAYNEAYPLAPGHAGRVPLYQLYPLLVHVLLFGSSYASQLSRAARAAARS